jgi:hypothetical protein
MEGFTDRSQVKLNRDVPTEMGDKSYVPNDKIIDIEEQRPPIGLKLSANLPKL